MIKKMNVLPVKSSQREMPLYTAPEIVLEIDLETRAGTVLDSVDPFDLTGIDPGFDTLP